MANIDSPLFQYLQDIPEGPTKVAIEHLFDLMRQVRTRTGGDSDLVSGSASASSTNFYAASLLSPESGAPSYPVEPDSPNFSLFNLPEEETLIGETSSIGVNSTVTPLSGAATFTGAGEQNDWPDVGVSCYADVAGTLYFDFSVNGTDWRTFPTNGFAVAAGIHEFHTAVKLGRYFRARFINGASAQSTFQLFTYYGKFRQPSAPLNQALSLDSDAIITRTTFPWLDVSRGLLTGLTDTKKFGRNAAIGTTYGPVALGGVYQTPQASGATALRIKAGGNAADTAAGAGAREITLGGLDENFEYATETLATAGASASSATTTTFTRLFRFYVSASGTYATASAGSHVGDIVIENSAGGTDWGTIDATNFPKSQSEISAYSVATGKTAYVFLDDITNESGKTLDAIFFQRTNIDQTAAPYDAMRAVVVLKGITSGVVNLAGRQTPLGPFVGPCDIGWLCKIDAGTAEVSAEFEIYEVSE